MLKYVKRTKIIITYKNGTFVQYTLHWHKKNFFRASRGVLLWAKPKNCVKYEKHLGNTWRTSSFCARAHVNAHARAEGESNPGSNLNITNYKSINYFFHSG